MRTKPNRLSLSVAATLLLTGLTAGAGGAAHAASEAALYKQADANRNGKLDETEFRGFIQALARDGNRLAKTVRFLGVYGLAFRITDKNKDGQLTGPELRRAAAENADKAR